MRRAQKMCETCPFRLKLSKKEVLELARLTPEEFECHTEAGYTWTDIQCRGHWQARRKFVTTVPSVPHTAEVLPLFDQRVAA